MTSRPRLGILISGRGSNMAAILDRIAADQLSADVAIVASNKADAAGLQVAADAGVETAVRLPADYADRSAYELELVRLFQDHGVDWVILAGYMKLLGPTLLAAYPNRILNIHPSLLPAFKGLDAQAQALAYGVKVAGCTVHIVTAGMDDGPIVMQTAVPVHSHDTVSSLSDRILAAEHQLYSDAIAWAISGDLIVTDRQVHVQPFPQLS